MKKKKKFLTSFLSLILVGILTIGLNSYAENERRNSLIDGLNAAYRETLLLKQENIKKLHKLKKDLDEFEAKGSEGISEDNLLYLTNKTGFSGKELDRALEGTDLYGLGDDFAKAEEKYGVNAIFLMAMAKHESGNGTSFLAREKNNLFGFNAIDKDPINAASSFKSKGESIDHVAKFLSENYLNKDGRFYNGVSTLGVGSDYATDPNRSRRVDGHMVEICEKLLN